MTSAYKTGLESLVCNEMSDASCSPARSHENLWHRIWHSQNLIAGRIHICMCRGKQQPADSLGFFCMQGLGAGGCKQMLHLNGLHLWELLSLCSGPAVILLAGDLAGRKEERGKPQSFGSTRALKEKWDDKAMLFWEEKKQNIGEVRSGA